MFFIQETRKPFGTFLQLLQRRLTVTLTTLIRMWRRLTVVHSRLMQNSRKLYCRQGCRRLSSFILLSLQPLLWRNLKFHQITQHSRLMVAYFLTKLRKNWSATQEQKQRLITKFPMNLQVLVSMVSWILITSSHLTWTKLRKRPVTPSMVPEIFKQSPFLQDWKRMVWRKVLLLHVIRLMNTR